MATYEGNRLPAPGIYKGATYVPVEILYSETGLFQKGGTLAPNQGVLAEGTGLKYDSATKKYVKATANADVECFLRYKVDTGSAADAPLFQGILLYGGTFKAATLSVNGANLTPTTAATLATALGGKYIASRDVFRFGF